MTTNDEAQKTIVRNAAIHGMTREEDAEPVGAVAALAFAVVAVGTFAAVNEVVAVATGGSATEGELRGKSDSDDESALEATVDCVDGQSPEAELSFMYTIILPETVNEKRTPLHICTKFSYIR